MLQKNIIDSLLSGFLSGTLTPKEKSDLYQYLADDGHQDEIMSCLQEQWAKSDWQAGGEISSDEMFAKIKSEIGKHPAIRNQKSKINPELASHFVHVCLAQYKQSTSDSGQKWKMLVRYAAILVIAFGLSLILQKTMTKSDKVAVVAETSQQYNEIFVPHGSKTKVILPDSSTVWLNAGAQLKYPVIFNGEERQVFLQGEGFFDVITDRQHPFNVNCNGVNIRVLGTKFNVMAYTGERVIETTLVEGTIEIQGVIDNIGMETDLRLKPGQKLSLRKENEQYEIQSIQEIDLSIAWMENKLVFVKERFSDVKTKLERWYGVTIEVKDPKILEYRITGTFENPTFEQAMSALSKAASYSFTMDKNHVIVSK